MSKSKKTPKTFNVSFDTLPKQVLFLPDLATLVETIQRQIYVENQQNDLLLSTTY